MNDKSSFFFNLSIVIHYFSISDNNIWREGKVSKKKISLLVKWTLFLKKTILFFFCPFPQPTIIFFFLQFNQFSGFIKNLWTTIDTLSTLQPMTPIVKFFKNKAAILINHMIFFLLLKTLLFLKKKTAFNSSFDRHQASMA